jgi:hypothetical protein
VRMTPESSDLSEEVRRELEPIIEILRDSLACGGCMFLVQSWHRLKYLPLLPFHLHLRWPGCLQSLSLNPSIGLVPFFESDHIVASSAIYNVLDVLQVRQKARVKRLQGPSSPDDLSYQDWESRVEKRLSKVGNLTLPGTSYVAIDQVSPEGQIGWGHRSVLGRMTSRTGLRPRVMVPSKRGVSATSAACFMQMDLLLINLQGLRGLRTLASVETILSCCASTVPILVVAATPTDVLPFIENLSSESSRVRFLGEMPTSVSASVAIVGRDRLSAEREFQFSIEGLEDQSSRMRDLVRLAKVAWWATRQTLYEPDEEQLELRRFVSAYDQARIDIPVDAGAFTAARDLLNRETRNRTLQSERAKAVIDATLTAPGKSSTLVLVRDEKEANKLRSALANGIGVALENLVELGVYVTARRDYWPDRSFSAAVAAGYFGTRTVDVLLASRAPVLRFVLDPIEARTAWFQLQKIASVLDSAGATAAKSVVVSMAEEIAPHAAPFSEVLELSMQISKSMGATVTDNVVRTRPVSSQDVTIVFDDGSLIEVGLQARFEVIREAGKRLKTLKAAALESGDQVVVLREDSHALFSEQLMDTLDRGPLADQAQKRATWLSVVQAVWSERRLSVQAISRAMREQGHSVDLVTVRSWLRFGRDEEASIPDQPNRFMAFALALGLTLPPETLLELYRGIQQWRTNHRRFGRSLVRAIRAAYLGRLDAVTLRKMEREWGLDARQLIEGARIAVVDEVLLPEGMVDAVD